MILAQGKKCLKGTALIGLLFGLALVPFFPAGATSVSRNSLVNLAGAPGETITADIVLEGTSAEDRTGYWYTNYKDIEGDGEKMDITSWITIEPKDFTIKQGEKKSFTVTVKVPRGIEPGLWGATSKEAGQEGHAGERRTYLVFKDAPSGGNVYSGLLIPVSVNVSASANSMAGVYDFILKNLIVIILSAVIIVMIILQLLRRKKGKRIIAR